MSSTDIKQQLTAAVKPFANHYYLRTSTPWTARAITDALTRIQGVASVGIITDPETFSVDANVELSTGEFVTVHVGTDEIGNLARILSGSTGISPDILERDIKISNLQGQLSTLQELVNLALSNANQALYANK